MFWRRTRSKVKKNLFPKFKKWKMMGTKKQGMRIKASRAKASKRAEQEPALHEAHPLREDPPVSFDCPGAHREVFFRQRCRFLHDVEEYLAAKPPDLGDCCVLFQTFGKCTYGATCRFAGAHLGPDRKNAVDTERTKEWEGKVAVRNGMTKELQQQLRKRKFPFEKAQEYLRHLSKANAGDRDRLDCKPIDAKAPDAECLPNEDTASPTGLDSEPLVDAMLPKTSGAVTDEDLVKLRPCEKRKLDLDGKLYLAPLTTCGNLPFRRVCKRYGADVTCGEMAVCTNLLQGQSSEWALLKRHHTEDLFGVQEKAMIYNVISCRQVYEDSSCNLLPFKNIYVLNQLEGAFPDTMTKCAELLNRTIEVDFVDINVGCPIDLIYNKGGGCALMARTNKFEQIVRGMDYVLDVPLTVKIRTGLQEKTHLAHKVIPRLREWGASMVTLHGRSREQRYTKVADWEYIAECAKLASPMPLFGNGDIFSFEDADRGLGTGVSGLMIARGALIKPWIFTEIKERRHWDISSSERLEILKDYTHHGLEHWGSDTQGVEKTRKFLLEWLSFLCRYIPAGLLERLPQRINERPPYYMGRDYMETLMASQNVDDWIKISEMLLGPVPSGFIFLPKHKANSYK